MSNKVAKKHFSTEEKWLFGCLRSFLGSEENQFEEMEHLDWNKVLGLAQSHMVLPFLYPLVECNGFPENAEQCIKEQSLQTVQQNYRLMFLTHFIVSEMRKEEIPVVVLKGVATAGLYPIPELRKSGDVDLLLTDSELLEKAKKVLNQVGEYKSEEQVNHHLVWRTKEGIDIELHVMLAEPFDSKEVNEYLECLKPQIETNIQWQEIMGIEFPVLSAGFHAYYLLLHMLQHYLRSGFGLKLLCDWVVFWNGEIAQEEIVQYMQLIRESGLVGFSDMVTGVCVTCLGLHNDQIICHKYHSHEYDIFIKDILEAEEFGQAEETRMVVMRGTGLSAYFREFHHQMMLNFPEKSRIWLFWPVLWGWTLIRFLYNNKKVRNVSGFQVLARARERSHISEKLRIFRKN